MSKKVVVCCEMKINCIYFAGCVRNTQLIYKLISTLSYGFMTMFLTHYQARDLLTKKLINLCVLNPQQYHKNLTLFSIVIIALSQLSTKDFERVKFIESHQSTCAFHSVKIAELFFPTSLHIYLFLL